MQRPFHTIQLLLQGIMLAASRASLICVRDCRVNFSQRRAGRWRDILDEGLVNELDFQGRL